MRTIEKVLVAIFVISATVISFHATNILADNVVGEKAYRTSEYKEYQSSREMFLLSVRLPIGIFFFILGLYFYKKLLYETFSVAFIAYGALVSTISSGLFFYRSIGTWAVSVELLILSAIGLIYIRRKTTPQETTPR